ncbi:MULTISPECIES: hypothetical protein [unclassified Stappia]|uniref:hypothetical protein n=1 Tax=unclassified Stappia TaxID=2629676 RepID=UPI001643DC13|nr:MULTISPECIES: hypothetical protein [unclassified Stappia]
METLLAPLASPLTLALLGAIMVLVIAGFAMIATGRRGERSYHIGYDAGPSDADAGGCDGD